MAGQDKRVVVAGLGYFSRFHLDAWAAQPGALLVGVCDRDETRLKQVELQRDVPGAETLAQLLQTGPVDLIDIVAPPPAHAALIRAGLAPGRTIICQKPFCTSPDEARVVMAEAADAGTELVIHENFRFQPWYRTIKAFLETGEMGAVYQARFALRPGDGRGPSAYLARQPAFQTMERLLIHETGVHFIDLFRWLFGPVADVYADLRRLNPVLAGDDTGLLVMNHISGVQSVFDGNRLADHAAPDMRRTMGEFLLEGEGGALSLTGDGALHFRPFGSTEARPLPLNAPVDESRFGGGCVAALIAHVVEALKNGEPPENVIADYLPVMDIAEIAYRSASEARRIQMPEGKG